MEALFITVVVVALIFEYTNGFHDAANAIATSIATRALQPWQALLMAGVLNVGGALLSTSVAATVAKGIVDSNVVTLHTVLAGLIGAIAWNLLTWYYGIPSSSSHCLIGGIVGATLGTVGTGVQWLKIVEKVVVPMVVSPLIGFIIGILLTVALAWMFRNSAYSKVNRSFKYIQTVSAALMALSHGQNDAQKTMGIILLALVAAGHLPQTADVPLWVKLSCALVMGLGTLSGGKRIIKTMGMKITQLRPVDGFAAETAASAVLLATGHLGFPVSTTHVITSSIMGVGATYRIKAVRWGITRSIVVAWILTLPASALIGAAVAYLFKVLIHAGLMR
ncbi:MAG: inorganic phosphate transporter [Verrucomicrobia bacterium GWF2_62_7]|nr:MAG: inorganic phosphate transporter [Verrucomicrobia bacterium GWF2_62_7]